VRRALGKNGAMGSLSTSLRLVGPAARRRSSVPARSGCSASTCAIGSCRPPTSCSTAA
jgi:hypothetical protein